MQYRLSLLLYFPYLIILMIEPLYYRGHMKCFWEKKGEQKKNCPHIYCLLIKLPISSKAMHLACDHATYFCQTHESYIVLSTPNRSDAFFSTKVFHMLCQTREGLKPVVKLSLHLYRNKK